MIGFLANEAVWPATGGGRVRMAEVVTALAQADRVRLLECQHPRHLAPTPERLLPDVEQVRLPMASQRWWGVVSSQPYLGRGLLDRVGSVAVGHHLRGASLLVVSHSYLAPQLPALSLPVVVDFPNLEVQRQASLAAAASGPRRLQHGLEARKARRWEPAVARAAHLVLAVDEADAQTLRGMGAREVLVVPNATSAAALSHPSPPAGYVLAVASAGYPPNADGLKRLVDDIWPLVRSQAPQARLVIAGTGTDSLLGELPCGVEVRGFVPDLQPLYEGAAVLAFPVDSGAGTQLKVAEGMGRGLTSVLSPYSARSVPPPYLPDALVAVDDREFAEHLVAALTDVERRHDRERRLRALPRMDWDRATRELVAWVSQHA